MVYRRREDDEDDQIIDLRNDENEPEFKIGSVEKCEPERSMAGMDIDPASQASGKVKVKFDKFVNLIATHAYEEIFNKHIDEDVIVSTDLLADLANAQEDKRDKKSSLLFVIGIVIGAVVVWLLLK